MTSKLSTIRDYESSYQKWEALDYAEKLEVAVNTLFVARKINETLKMSVSDYAKVDVELCCNEDEIETTPLDCYLSVKDGASFECFLSPGDQSHPLIDDNLWDSLFYFLQDIEFEDELSCCNQPLKEDKVCSSCGERC